MANLDELRLKLCSAKTITEISIFYNTNRNEIIAWLSGEMLFDTNSTPYALTTLQYDYFFKFIVRLSTEIRDSLKQIHKELWDALFSNPWIQENIIRVLPATEAWVLLQQAICLGTEMAAMILVIKCVQVKKLLTGCPPSYLIKIIDLISKYYPPEHDLTSYILNPKYREVSLYLNTLNPHEFSRQFFILVKTISAGQLMQLLFMINSLENLQGFVNTHPTCRNKLYIDAKIILLKPALRIQRAPVAPAPVIYLIDRQSPAGQPNNSASKRKDPRLVWKEKASAESKRVKEDFTELLKRFKASRTIAKMSELCRQNKHLFLWVKGAYAHKITAEESINIFEIITNDLDAKIEFIGLLQALIVSHHLQEKIKTLPLDKAMKLLGHLSNCDSYYANKLLENNAALQQKVNTDEISEIIKWIKTSAGKAKIPNYLLIQRLKDITKYLSALESAQFGEELRSIVNAVYLITSTKKLFKCLLPNNREKLQYCYQKYLAEDWSQDIKKLFKNKKNVTRIQTPKTTARGKNAPRNKDTTVTTQSYFPIPEVVELSSKDFIVDSEDHNDEFGPTGLLAKKPQDALYSSPPRSPFFVPAAAATPASPRASSQEYDEMLQLPERIDEAMLNTIPIVPTPALKKW